MQDNGRFATDSQGHKQTLGHDPRTGTFHQTRPTMGDISCSVKGVFGKFFHHTCWNGEEGMDIQDGSYFNMYYSDRRSLFTS